MAATRGIILVEGRRRQIYPAAPPGAPARAAMLDFVVYLLYRTGSAVAAALPLPFLFVFGEFLGICACIFSGKYRRLATRNLEIAFANEKSPRELRQLVRRHFRRLGANLLCSAKLTQIPPEKILECVEVENIESMAREFRAGVPVVLILSHLGTWEVFAQLMPKFVGFVRNSSVYQGLGNRFIDKHVRRTRSQTGLELFDRHDGFEPVIELLRSGGGVGVLSDQHAGLTSKINQVIGQQIRRAPEDWFWVHNRWKTPQPNFLLAHYKRGIYLPPGISAGDLKPFRILIRSSNWLGDAVMSVPAIRAIKHSRPDVHMTIAAPEKIAPMWKLIPEVDAIIPLPDTSLPSVVRLLKQQMLFDVAILFPNSLRVALESWLSGIPRRVGYRGHWRSWLVNQIVREPRKPGPPEHHSLRFLRIARECGAETEKTSNVQRPTLNVQPSDSNQLSTINHQPLKIGLCTGAEYGPAKRWLPERFAEAAAKITEQSSAQWILLGTKNDAAIGEQIAAAIGNHCVNRIGQTTLGQLIDELRQCSLLLTNDTGTMHLATLLGVPVVAVFGSTEPRLTGPLGNGHTILRHHVECSPCFLRVCPIDFRCMKAVSADEVAGAVLSMLAK